ncbi:hypothetical protein YC2023_048153 [Brassica napus]
MLHGNGNGYAEAEAYRSAEARFFEKLGSGYVLEAYIHMSFWKRDSVSFHKVPKREADVRSGKREADVR